MFCFYHDNFIIYKHKSKKVWSKTKKILAKKKQNGTGNKSKNTN